MTLKEKYSGAFSTLLHSWGGDTPSEAVWAANEFMQALLGKEDIIMLDEDYEGCEEFMAQLESPDKTKYCAWYDTEDNMVMITFGTDGEIEGIIEKFNCFIKDDRLSTRSWA